MVAHSITHASARARDFHILTAYTYIHMEFAPTDVCDIRLRTRMLLRPEEWSGVSPVFSDLQAAARNALAERENR